MHGSTHVTCTFLCLEVSVYEDLFADVSLGIYGADLFFFFVLLLSGVHVLVSLSVIYY
jgi:hypothetical protein